MEVEDDPIVRQNAVFGKTTAWHQPRGKVKNLAVNWDLQQAIGSIWFSSVMFHVKPYYVNYQHKKSAMQFVNASHLALSLTESTAIPTVDRDATSTRPHRRRAAGR